MLPFSDPISISDCSLFVRKSIKVVETCMHNCCMELCWNFTHTVYPIDSICSALITCLASDFDFVCLFCLQVVRFLRSKQVEANIVEKFIEEKVKSQVLKSYLDGVISKSLLYIQCKVAVVFVCQCLLFYNLPATYLPGYSKLAKCKLKLPKFLC